MILLVDGSSKHVETKEETEPASVPVPADDCKSEEGMKRGCGDEEKENEEFLSSLECSRY